MTNHLKAKIEWLEAVNAELLESLQELIDLQYILTVEWGSLDTYNTAKDKAEQAMAKAKR